jgi:uncharacterized membrane-anchored protein YitT (DUF2179 family)
MKKTIKSYLFIAIGAFLLAAGLNMFLVPCKISSGGVSSIGTMLLYKFNIPMSVTNIFFNAVLFVLGYKYVGKNSVLKTVAGIIFLSAFLEITKYLPAFGDDIFISTVIGGALVGIGVGLVVKVEASSGGSDFAGLILKKFFPHIPIATLILFIDGAIIIIAGIVFKSYMITFYSAIAMFIASKVTDSIMTMGDAAKSVYIMSPENEKISKVIMETFERGVTGVYSKGLYTGSENMMLLCAVSPKQLPRLVNKVKEIDKGAFIIVSDAKEVLGEGFKEN